MVKTFIGSAPASGRIVLIFNEWMWVIGLFHLWLLSFNSIRTFEFLAKLGFGLENWTGLGLENQTGLGLALPSCRRLKMMIGAQIFSLRAFHCCYEENKILERKLIFPPLSIESCSFDAVVVRANLMFVPQLFNLPLREGRVSSNVEIAWKSSLFNRIIPVVEMRPPRDCDPIISSSLPPRRSRWSKQTGIKHVACLTLIYARQILWNTNNPRPAPFPRERITKRRRGSSELMWSELLPKWKLPVDRGPQAKLRRFFAPPSLSLSHFLFISTTSTLNVATCTLGWANQNGFRVSCDCALSNEWSNFHRKQSRPSLYAFCWSFRCLFFVSECFSYFDCFLLSVTTSYSL